MEKLDSKIVAIPIKNQMKHKKAKDQRDKSLRKCMVKLRLKTKGTYNIEMSKKMKKTQHN